MKKVRLSLVQTANELHFLTGYFIIIAKDEKKNLLTIENDKTGEYFVICLTGLTGYDIKFM